MNTNILKSSGCETEAEKAEALEHLIAGEKNLIRVTTTNRDPQFYQRVRTGLVATIERATRELNELDDSYRNADAIIDAAKRRLENLLVQKKLLGNKHLIHKLLRLQESIDKLQNETPDEEPDDERTILNKQRKKLVKHYHRGRRTLQETISELMKLGLTETLAKKYIAGE